jgi:RNA recognition motif-containing protein
MLKLFVANLPADTTDQEFNALFATHGRVRSSKLARDLFSGKCRGFGSLEMEGHEARAAIAGLNGKELRGNVLKVGEERKQSGSKRGYRRH